jgi:hypothetical protein
MYQGRLRSHAKHNEIEEAPDKKRKLDVSRACRRVVKRKLETADEKAKVNTDVSTARLCKWLASRVRLVPKNKVDPITLEPPVPPIFKHVSDEGYVTAFDAATLANYFRATGNFVHPTTRQSFNRVEIRRLDKVLQATGPSLTETREELEARRGRSLEQLAEVRRLETTLQITFDDMLSASRLNQNPRHALNQMILLFFPAYHMMILQLLALHQPVAAVLDLVVAQCQAVMETVDRHHLELVSLILAELEAVCETLHASMNPVRP